MIKTEATALKLSVYGNCFLGIFAIMLAWHSQSIVILTESAFIAVTLVTSVTTVRIAKLLSRKPTQARPFGLVFLEPFFNLFKGGLLLTVAVYGAWMSLQSLLGDPQPIVSQLTVLYGGGAFIVCTLVVILQFRASKHFNSPMLKVEILDFAIGAGIGLAIMLGFLASNALIGTEWERISAYTDPVLTILVILFAVPAFLAIIKESSQALLHINHNLEIEAEIVQVVEQERSFPLCEISAQEIGRTLYVIIAVKPDEEFYSQTLGTIMNVKQKLDKKINAAFPGAMVDIIFDPETTTTLQA